MKIEFLAILTVVNVDNLRLGETAASLGFHALFNGNEAEFKTPIEPGNFNKFQLGQKVKVSVEITKQEDNQK